jgi:hypothetical protein
VTGFVDRLAAVALGMPQPGAARVALPPRFPPPSGAVPFDQSDALPGDDFTAARRSLQPVTARVSPSPSEPATATHDGGTSAQAINVALSQANVATPAPLPRSTAPAPAVETASVESASNTMPPAPPVMSAIVRDRRAAPRPDASSEPTSARAHVHTVASILPATDRTTLAAPLSDVSVASRIAQPRDERPVVHVTIDRIDVRAAAAAKSEPAARRARPQPAVSLTEYLRGERGGRA